MIPVILSGGSGTRLWPVSRKTHPKQFWPLASKSSMLQETCQRLKDHVGSEDPIVVCNTDHRFFVAHQLEELGLEHTSIILEPMGRNTAPATAVAALHALDSKAAHGTDDPALLILPADHVIADIPAFHQILEQGERLAEEGHLVTFGIVPTGPEAGYGYIQSGDGIGPEDQAPTAMSIRRFVEKPGKATAEEYIASGDYFWNSGMFMFRASRYLEELETFAPDMLKAARAAYEKANRDMDFIRLDAEAFGKSPSDSIDYAVMEHTQNGVVIPLDAGWDDVGSWSALWEIGEKDEAGNVITGDVLTLESTNNYLRSEGRLLATIGINDLVVIDTPDVIMVAPRDQVQKVKDLVAQTQRRPTP